MAAEYHWSPRYVEGQLTDELFILYLDAAVDRLGDRAKARFETLVEAVRAGTIFGHDDRQYRKWTGFRRAAATESHGLRGAALEQAVMALARAHPEYVVVGE